MTTTSLKTPSHMARSLSISHPNPPAPTTSILASRSEDDRAAPTSPGGGGSNSPTGNDPVSFEYGLLRDSRVESVPRCRRERGGGASRRVVVVAAAVVDISDESRLLLLMLLLAPSLAEAVIPRYRQ